MQAVKVSSAKGDGVETRRRRQWLRPGLALSLLMTTALATPLFLPVASVNAQTTAATTVYAIEAQPLSSALMQFSNATGVQLFFNAEAVRGLTSPGASGPLSREEALSRLLSGSGLTYNLNGNAVTISDPASAPVAYDGSVVLETIDVTAWVQSAATGSGFQGTPDWVYETPESISVIGRDAIVTSPTRNPRDLLDSVSGVWVNRSDIQNPGITVNIRGLDDSNRVAVMVDGARQNFTILGHNSYSRSYVDSAFIRSAEVYKTGATGVGGGTLGGGVNFRTLIASDLIEPGRDWGVEIDATTGTNAYNGDVSIVGGWRPSEYFALSGGLSYKNIGDYAIGQNGIDQLSALAPDSPTFSGSVSNGLFLKAEIDPTPDLDIDLSWVRYNADANEGTLNEDSIAYGAYNQLIRNDAVTANVNWNPAGNDLVDLTAKLWVNDLDMSVAYEGNDFFVATDYDYRLTTIGGSIENTSRFFTDSGELALHYGVEAFRDFGENSTSNALIDADPTYASGYGGNNGLATRDFVSGFANATYEHDNWLTVSGGLRYDWYRMNGSTTFYDRYVAYETVTDWRWVQEEVHYPAITVCDYWLGQGRPQAWIDKQFPNCANEIYQEAYTDLVWVYKEVDFDRAYQVIDAHDISVDHSSGALLPNISVAAQVTDWFQPFISYGHSFRPPTIMESLFSGGHPGSSAATEWAPNPDLRPETARTLEIGANFSHDAIFTADDSFRAKAVYFYRDIEDYIVLGRVARPEAVSGNTYTSFINVPGITHMQGVELEANYDARDWYVGGSATWLDVDFSDVAPTSNFYSTEAGTISGNTYFAPPRFKLALDGGIRFFEEKLTVGGRVTHVSGEQESNWVLTPGAVSDYTVFDLYASYEINNNATLRAAVTNLTDLAYTPALGLSTHPAPGRTFTVSLNARF